MFLTRRDRIALMIKGCVVVVDELFDSSKRTKKKIGDKNSKNQQRGRRDI